MYEMHAESPKNAEFIDSQLKPKLAANQQIHVSGLFLVVF